MMKRLSKALMALSMTITQAAAQVPVAEKTNLSLAENLLFLGVILFVLSGPVVPGIIVFKRLRARHKQMKKPS